MGLFRKKRTPWKPKGMMNWPMARTIAETQETISGFSLTRKERGLVDE